MKKKFDDGGTDSEACDCARGKGGGQDRVGARWAAMGGSAFLRSCAVTLSVPIGWFSTWLHCGARKFGTRLLGCAKQDRTLEF
jgi:hypothetical protein